jgi:arylsulfatase A-like enzyme
VLHFAPCTVNRTFLSPYDERVRYTPHLADFAETAAVFERHVSESGQSGIAYASLFSGRQADGHGVFSHPRFLGDEITLLTETFAKAGYRPFFWSGQRMGSALLNYGQGVASRDAVHSLSLRHPEELLTESTAMGLTANVPRFDALLRELQSNPDRRAYVQVNFTITHGPHHLNTSRQELLDFAARHPELAGDLEPEEIDRLTELYAEHRFDLEWDTKRALDRLGLQPSELQALARVLELWYAASIERLDRCFGRLLERIDAHGLGDQSLVVFTADHGEVLRDEHGAFRWTHGLQLSPEVLQVPLLIRGAGVQPGRYAEVTRSIDLFPTIASLAGAGRGAPKDLPGENLARALRGRARAPELLAWSHTSVLGPHQLDGLDSGAAVSLLHPRREDPETMWVSVRERDLVLELRPDEAGDWTPRLFDLAADPHRRIDLYDPSDRKLKKRLAALEEYKRSLVEGFHHHAALDGRRELTDQQSLEYLRSLGYIR